MAHTFLEAGFIRQLLILLFAVAGGLTLSGIAANLYRLLAREPAKSDRPMSYYAVMAFAGPTVLFNNATKSYRSRDCSVWAYLLAVMLTGYWSFALGLLILSLYIVKI